MKKHFILIPVLTLFLLTFSIKSRADNPGGLNAGVDITSRYIWRGINLGGPSPHLQPYIEYSFPNTGLTVGFWGSYGLSSGSALAEADFYISYSPVELFTLTVTDYFFPSDLPFSQDQYFNYRKGGTGHTLEGKVSFNGTERFPVSVLFAMNLYGADGVNEDGDNYYAKYLELGYTATLTNFALEAFIGMALDNPKTGLGAEGWYGDSGGIINLGVNLSRALRLTETMELPVFSSLIFNPQAGNMYMVIGISF